MGAIKMKKLLMLIMVFLLITTASFAKGFTQYDLAELLINKAKAEKLIEDKVYSEDEIILLVKSSELYEVTDLSKEVTIEAVRQAFVDYDINKKNLMEDEEVDSLIVEIYDREQLFKELDGKDRKLSHEFMKKIATTQKYKYDNNLKGVDDVEGETFDATYVSTEANKYAYELYRILGWYALEYDLYVHWTPHNVALYRRKLDFINQSDPLMNFGFIEEGYGIFDDFKINTRVKVTSLYFVREIPNDTRESKMKRIEATGYAEPRFIMALKDALSVFIQDEKSLNVLSDTIVSDVIENQYKDYSYDKDRYETFGKIETFISINQGEVFYHFYEAFKLLEE